MWRPKRERERERERANERNMSIVTDQTKENASHTIQTHLGLEAELVVFRKLAGIVRVSCSHAEPPRVHDLPAEVEVRLSDDHAVTNAGQAFGARRIGCCDVPVRQKTVPHHE